MDTLTRGQDSITKRIMRQPAYIRRHGLRPFLMKIMYLIADWREDQQLGVRTAGWIDATELDYEKPESLSYTPLSYYAIRTALKMIPLEGLAPCSFLDFGSGKGRALMYAATLPFQRVIGVELSAELIATAQRNAKRLRHRKAHISIVHGDAAEFIIPLDVKVFYFFNPFVGDILRRVISNIRASYVAAPRRIFVVFFNNREFEQEIASHQWLVKVHHGNAQYPFGIYEAPLRKEALLTQNH